MSKLPSGSGVPVQVHRPVPYPVLAGDLRDGRGAVQSEHPGALPVDSLCPEPGQPQLREPGVHAGQIVHTSDRCHLATTFNLCSWTFFHLVIFFV